MRWRGRRQSSNIEDRRGARGRGFGRRLSGRRLRLPMGRGGRRRGGKLSIGFLVVAGLVIWLMGGNPLQVLSLMLGGEIPLTQSSGNSGNSSGSYEAQTVGRQDEMRQFVATVLADTEDSWHKIFNAQGQTYREPKLVLFTGQVQSACGFASSASGPFYCPGDSKVYIDLSFYNELRKKFEAPGDFAQAYVLAHEVGHHVQNLIGVLPEFNRIRRSLSKAQENAMSIRVELQADCFAGVWGFHSEQQGLLEEGDLEEALNAATQIGDDAIQKRLQGYVVPESFNHGTSEQRKRWFLEGFRSGEMQACDTFAKDVRL
ncbi:KPN_02809 family neutral zinc metallopeptidase [Coralliovum pocilloporae]|uniref:KPN_02809 family neutral zinc metallopeptidase n=1 Tax=Coralliovum pocilloporae TaxID=3066369 RepID=UPI00330768CB